jgi:hypothetical protein
MSNLFGPRNSLLGALLESSNSNQTTKRKAFFSFDYDDVMRVNNVRQAWKIDHPDNALMRSFYDSSLWESRKAEGDDAVKQLIRDGVQYTSAICVLAGTNTWSRRWVKYEVARAVIDGRGLLTVHINGLNHHVRRAPDLLGYNPLDFLGVYKQANGSFYLYERRWVTLNLLTQLGEWQWHPYQDYTQAVALPAYLQEPDVGWVRFLSAGTSVYNYATQDGHKNIGAWIDTAAKQVGR